MKSDVFGPGWRDLRVYLICIDLCVWEYRIYAGAVEAGFWQKVFELLKQVFKAKKIVIYRNGTRQQWQMWFSQFIKSDNIRRGFNIPRGEMQMCLLVVSFTRKGRHTYCYHVSASSSLYQHLPSFIDLGLCGISNVLLIGEALFCSIE